MDPEILNSILKLLARLSAWTIQPPTRKDIVEAHFDLDLLEYQVTPKVGWTMTDPPRATENPICAAPGCKAGWREGLVNQALPSADPVWYCREHEPDYQANGISRPPGSKLPSEPALQKAREMSKAWNRALERLEAQQTGESK